MKNLGILLGALLLFAACGGEDEKKVGGEEIDLPDMADVKFAFYVEDSIPSHFTYFIKAQTELEGKAAAFQQKLFGLQQKGQQIVGEYQRLQGQLSENQNIEYQRRIGTIENQIQTLQGTEGMQLEQESMNGTAKMQEKLQKYGKEYAEEKGIEIFLTKGMAGSVLHIDPSMDVTMDFIEFMNEREAQINGAP